jgi:nucleoside-diphosphate-sugar epimerase
MEACARGTSGLRRFVLLSSIAAAGPAPQGRPLNEADACRPVSPYGRSKLLAEEAASGFMARMPLVVIRPPNVLGVGQRELSSVLRLLNRGIVPLVGSRRPQTSILFVEDLVRALALVADRDAANGKTYYVAADEPRSWRGILDALLAELAPGLLLKIPHPLLMGVALVAEAAARLTGGTPLLTRSDLRSARDNLWLCDAGLIRRELGFAATVEFSQGIRDIVRRFDRRHGTWQDSGDG